MAIIRKKIHPEYFEQVQQGRKTFELRLNDFDIKEGDKIILEEWDPETKQYTGRSIRKTAGYIFRFCKDDSLFWNKEDVEKHGFQVISLL